MKEESALGTVEKQGKLGPLKAICRPHLQERGGGNKYAAKAMLLNIGPNLGSINKWPVILGSTRTLQK